MNAGGLCLASTATRKGDLSALASPTDTSGAVAPGQHDKLPVHTQNLPDVQRSHLCAVLPWPRASRDATHQEPDHVPAFGSLTVSLWKRMLAPNRIVDHGPMGALVGWISGTRVPFDLEQV